MKRLLVVVSVVMMFTVGVSPTGAQGDAQCANIIDWEGDTVGALLRDYDDVQADASEIEVAADLQTMRRELDEEDAPPEAAEIKALLVRMVDLRTDAVVAFNLRNEGLGERLMADAEDARDEALRQLNDLLARCNEGTVESAQITEPEAGALVDHETVVEGTYDPATLGDKQLWVVLWAQDNKFYPQVIIDPDCNEGDASSVTYGPRPGAWRITVYIGEEGNAFSGHQYDIILYAAEPDEHEAMLDLMGDWCRNRSYPGLTDVSLPPYGFEYIDSVRVTRR